MGAGVAGYRYRSPSGVLSGSGAIEFRSDLDDLHTIVKPLFSSRKPVIIYR